MPQSSPQEETPGGRSGRGRLPVPPLTFCCLRAMSVGCLALKGYAMHLTTKTYSCRRMRRSCSSSSCRSGSSRPSLSTEGLGLTGLAAPPPPPPERPGASRRPSRAAAGGARWEPPGATSTSRLSSSSPSSDSSSLEDGSSMVLAGAPGLLAERSCPRGSAGAWVRARRPQNERESGPGFPDTSSSAPECLPRPGRGAGERSRGRREAELARGRSGRPGTARPASGPPARARPQPRRRRRPPAARAGEEPVAPPEQHVEWNVEERPRGRGVRVRAPPRPPPPGPAGCAWCPGARSLLGTGGGGGGCRAQTTPGHGTAVVLRASRGGAAGIGAGNAVL